MPTIYYYSKQRKRLTVIIFLQLVIAGSITYLILVTLKHDLSTLLVFDSQSQLANLVFRKPFGPTGYYALGILLAIFYFEYQQGIANRGLRELAAYKLMNFIGMNRRRCLLV